MTAEIIQIRKKKNHNVTRSIKVSSLKSFSKFGWEIIPNQETKIVAAKKKAVAAPAESNATVHTDIEITSIDGAEFQTTFTESEGGANVTFQVAETSEIDALRDEYETITGKPADKRWNAKRITAEIEKLK